MNKAELSIEVGNVKSRIIYDPEIYTDYFVNCLFVIDNKLSFFMPNYENNKDYHTILPDGTRRWDGKTHLFNPYPHTKYYLGAFEFYTGKIYEIVAMLIQFGYKLNFIDDRNWYKRDEDRWSWNKDFEPYDYQEEAANRAVKEGRGIIKVATSGGKCISSDSLVFINNVGLVEIGSICNNLEPCEDKDYCSVVYTPLTPNKKDITSKIYRDGISLSYKIKTSKGYEECGTGSHRIKVLDENGNVKWKKLEDIVVGDYAIISKNQGVFGSNEFLDKDSEFKKSGIFPDQVLVSNKESCMEYFNSVISDTNGCVFFKEEKCANKFQVFLLNIGFASKKIIKNGIFYVKIIRNNQLVPNQKNKLSNIVDILLTNIKNINNDKVFCHWYNNILKFSKRNFISVKRLKDISSWLRESELFDSYKEIKDYCEHFDFITSNDLFFDIISHKEQVESDNYDFVVPESNSFVANGFINHNTNIGARIIYKLGLSPSVFFVTTRELLEQAKARIESLLGVEVGKVGDGHCEIKDITICTIQTCFAAFGREKELKKQSKSLGGEFSLEKEDKLDEDKYEQVRDLIKSCKMVIFDEAHHAAADTCKGILELCENASYRYGLSATVQRDDGMEKMIEGLFGRYLADISMSFIIDKKQALAPEVYLLPIESDLGLCENYQAEYKTYVVDNDERNEIIANIAAQGILNNKSTLVLVKQIPHGEKLAGMIKEKLIENNADENDVVFLHGKVKKKTRTEIIDKLKSKEIKCCLASVHKNEVLWVKNGNNIQTIEAEDFAKKFEFNKSGKWEGGDTGEYNNEEIQNWETLSESKDGKVEWKKIRGIIRHKASNLAKVKFDNGFHSLITTNHSLINKDGESVVPENGLEVKTSFFEVCGNKEYLDVIDLINKSKLSNEEFDVQIFDIDKKFIYKLKQIKNGKILDEKIMPDYLEDPVNLLNFVKEFEKIVIYDGRKYRVKLEDFKKSKYIKKFRHKIICKRGKQDFVISDKIKITKELATLMGIFIAEGSLLKSNKSSYKINIACFEDIKNDDRVGFRDKIKIRQEAIEYFRSVFGVEPNKNNKNVYISGKLPYAIFDGLNMSTRKENSKLRGRKRVPPFIWECNKEIQKAFLWGYFLGDGSYSKVGRSNKLSYISVSYELLCGVKQLLMNLGCKNILISTKKNREEHWQKCYELYVKDDPFFNTSEHQHPNSYFQKETSVITSIKDIEDYDDYVYDFSVEDNENFYSASGVLQHNTSLGDEGLDISPLEILIMAVGGKSYIKVIQRVGRVVRKDKDNLEKIPIVYDFIDPIQAKFLRKHSNIRKKIYESEEAFKVIDLSKKKNHETWGFDCDG